MLSIINGEIKYDYRFCQQCGACYAVCANKAISLQPTNNGLCLVLIDKEKCVVCRRCLSVCPAKREATKSCYIEALKQKKFYLVFNDNPIVRRASSSGGACKTLIIKGLQLNRIDAVYSLKKIENYPCAIGEYYTKDNIPEYNTIPNSVYHSIMACKELGKVTKTERLMIVGTSCQLYAMEKALKGKYKDIIKVCIFCKQQKTLQCTEWLAKVMGEKIIDRKNFKAIYRGEGWPGIVRIMNGRLAWEKAAGLPFGRRLWCVPGCNICGDPFGMEVDADLTLMDPWHIRKSNNLGETLVCVHTEKGKEFLLSIDSLNITQENYEYVKPALGEDDIRRKRMLVPFFKGSKVSKVIKKAGEAEINQRRLLEKILEITPKLPFSLYRVLNKIVPIRRDSILKG